MNIFLERHSLSQQGHIFAEMKNGGGLIIIAIKNYF